MVAQALRAEHPAESLDVPCFGAVYTAEALKVPFVCKLRGMQDMVLNMQMPSVPGCWHKKLLSIRPKQQVCGESTTLRVVCACILAAAKVAAARWPTCRPGVQVAAPS